MTWSSQKEGSSPNFMGCVVRSKVAKGKAVGTLFSPENQMWWVGSFYVSKLS